MDKLIHGKLIEAFNKCLQENVRLENYTTIRIGGCADALLIAHSSSELEDFIKKAWQINIPVLVLGSGSNVLISDAGVHGVVIINHAHNIKINAHNFPATLWAESGALMSKAAQQTATRAYSGLEWAASLPGTVGGAIFGNAGCFGQEISCNLLTAEILHRVKGKKHWSSERLNFAYRTSSLKRENEDAVILSALLKIESGNPDTIITTMKKNKNRRTKTQPPGASMGSIFRNPKGAKAGRLIEAAGLKGKRIGGAEISPMHANFIINTGRANAQDVWALIDLMHRTVLSKFGIKLYPEIQLIGDWDKEVLLSFNEFMFEQVTQ
ncbi:MAG TPA: UDP-N-acetylmuramate dehydrogenase [Anaerolineae bacterium]|nr:UDP-N-acetylmuramate dehydrogenase [Anaerolineae bacterium]